MYTTEPFGFVSPPPSDVDVTIEGTLRGKSAVLSKLATSLRFSEYFGENWDTLIDCLSDLSWLQTSEVIIDHSAVPDPPRGDLRLYLESLLDSIERRRSSGLPKLRVLFRAEDQAKIAEALTQPLRPIP